MKRFVKLGIAGLLVAGVVAASSGVASAHGGGRGSGGHDHGGSGIGSTVKERVLAQIAAKKAQKGLKTLGDKCRGNSDLKLHTGFQSADAVCVDTEFGEQSAFKNNPTLLIVDAPESVAKGQDIVLKVSTRNLVRDRFLGAAAGGYYLESAFLNDAGLTRGHFHSGCRLLDGGDAAPAPFRLDGDGVNRFVATEDGKQGTEPVTITIKGFSVAGEVQCASWSGDGSHRIPMMAFANEIPAFDSVRVEVK